MDAEVFDMGPIDIAWCPGCGNFAILKALKQALAELEVQPQQLVLVSGIGQAAKTPHYLRGNVFNGLHGRALPAATAIKACNPALTVIAQGGDGDMYGEGGNHLLHTIRRNPDITNIVHNNMVYGLTKGQASPTSQVGFKTPVQVNGAGTEPLNPMALAIAMDASFVGRAFTGDLEQTTDIFKRAITHKGYALVDVLQPCPSFNKINTYQWFKDRCYYLDDSHDANDRNAAFAQAVQKDKLPLGVLYSNPGRTTFEETLSVHGNGPQALFRGEPDTAKLEKLIASFSSGV